MIHLRDPPSLTRAEAIDPGAEGIIKAFDRLWGFDSRHPHIAALGFPSMSNRFTATTGRYESKSHGGKQTEFTHRSARTRCFVVSRHLAGAGALTHPARVGPSWQSAIRGLDSIRAAIDESRSVDAKAARFPHSENCEQRTSRRCRCLRGGYMIPLNSPELGRTGSTFTPSPPPSEAACLLQSAVAHRRLPALVRHELAGRSTREWATHAMIFQLRQHGTI